MFSVPPEFFCCGSERKVFRKGEVVCISRLIFKTSEICFSLSTVGEFSSPDFVRQFFVWLLHI